MAYVRDLICKSEMFMENFFFKARFCLGLGKDRPLDRLMFYGFYDVYNYQHLSCRCP